MSEERVVEADAIQVFVDQQGIRIHFGRETTPPGSDEGLIETVSKVVVSPAAFRRLGMSLHEALRRLPREQAPLAPPPAQPYVQARPAASPAATATSRPRGKGPQISFIGSGAPSGAAAPSSRPSPSPSSGPPTASSSPAPSSAAPEPPSSARRAGGKPPLEDLLEPTSDMPSSRAVAPATSEHATRLQRAISALGAPYVQERSFRMRQGELLANRFLVSVGRPDDGSASDDALLRAFAQIGLPATFVEAARDDLPRARCVHFGFEGDGDSPLLKVYLEVGGEEQIGAGTGEPVKAAIGTRPGTAASDDASGDARAANAVAGGAANAADAMPEPVLEHIAYKWNPTAPDAGVVGRYWWYPHLPVPQLRARVAEVYAGGAPESQQIAFEVIDLAAARMPERDIHYLEIEEENKPRRSYSINFYDAELRVRELHPLLSRMRRLFEVPPGRFQVLYDQVKGRRFGHLAGGVHRNGHDFFNVYYGPQFFDSGAPRGPWRAALLRAGEGETAS